MQDFEATEFLRRMDAGEYDENLRARLQALTSEQLTAVAELIRQHRPGKRQSGAAVGQS